MTREASHELDVIFEIWMWGLLDMYNMCTVLLYTRDVVERVCSTCTPGRRDFRIKRKIAGYSVVPVYTRIVLKKGEIGTLNF